MLGRAVVSMHSLTCLLATLQEREEAARVFGAGAEAPAATFEPDEELAQAEEAVAVVPAPAPTKGPTAEQLTAIKVRWWRSFGWRRLLAVVVLHIRSICEPPACLIRLSMLNSQMRFTLLLSS